MTGQNAPFAPDWASPPGDTIADLIEERGGYRPSSPSEWATVRSTSTTWSREMQR